MFRKKRVSAVHGLEYNYYGGVVLCMFGNVWMYGQVGGGVHELHTHGTVGCVHMLPVTMFAA